MGFANWFSNYSLGVEGQEDIMAVQYNPGQEYMLHCDGSCDGTPFVQGRGGTQTARAPSRCFVRSVCS